MVRAILELLRKEASGLHEAAFLLGFFSLSSQVLALLRDRLLAGEFGAGSSLDIYYAAFRVPDFLYVSIASFISITVLIPFLSRFQGEDGTLKSSQNFLDSVMTFFLATMAISSMVAFILMPKLSPIIAPGFSAEELDSLTNLSRILLLSPLLLGLSNLFGSITQIRNKFFVYGMSPVLYNLGIILGILFFYPIFGLNGLAYGVILGALLHLLIQLPVLLEGKVVPFPTARVNLFTLREVIELSLPRTLTLSLSHIVLLSLIALSTTISEGSVAIFNFSFNLQSVPLALIGVSYSLAAFPTLASLFSRGETARFRAHLVSALQHVLFWSLPIIVLFIVLRAHIVRVVLGSGLFSWSDTKLTAAALAIFSVSIAAQGAVLLLVRGFYASGKTKAPLLIGLFSSAVSIFGAYFLLDLFQSNFLFRAFFESLLRVSGTSGTAFLMLPLAYSIGVLLNATLLWIFFSRNYGASAEGNLLRRSFFESFATAILSGAGAYLSLNIFDVFFNLNSFVGVFTHGVLSGAIGVAIGYVVLRALGSVELKGIEDAFRKKFWRTDVIAPELSEL